jgi:nitroreductase
MDVLESMKARHAVRSYLDKPIEAEKRSALETLVASANKESGLHLQLCFDEPKAFDTFLAHYGHFVGVKNYLALVGPKDQEEAIGYYGEKIVLAAQAMGLNSCWVALTYGKGKTPVKLEKGEKLHCVIALGYGAVQGFPHKSKDEKGLASFSGDKPAYWDQAIQAIALAPTATNQQKFFLKVENGLPSLSIKGSGFYTKIDLGIVKYHFEAATGIKLHE